MTKSQLIDHTAGADVSTINEAVSPTYQTISYSQKDVADELARSSGVSKGMLVEIEGCKANPSIALLCKIAAAMESVRGGFCQRVASEPMVHILSTGMLFRCCGAARKRGSKTTAGTSGRICWNLAMIRNPREQFESAGHPADTCELLRLLIRNTDINSHGRRFIIIRERAARCSQKPTCPGAR